MPARSDASEMSVGRRDRALLASELHALADLDFAVEIAGFSLPDIEVGAPKPRRKPENADNRPPALTPAGQSHMRTVPVGGNEAMPLAPPPLAAATVSRGDDLRLIDRHRLLCGDLNSAAAVDRLLLGKPAALVATDPAACDALVRAFERATGRAARLAATGKSFADVAAQRGSASAIQKKEMLP